MTHHNSAPQILEGPYTCSPPALAEVGTSSAFLLFDEKDKNANCLIATAIITVGMTCTNDLLKAVRALEWPDPQFRSFAPSTSPSECFKTILSA